MPSRIHAVITGTEQHGESVEDRKGRLDISNAQEFHSASTYIVSLKDKRAREYIAHTFTYTCAQEVYAYKVAVTKRD